MKRGSVYWVNLGPSSPPELGKTRPAIILSNTLYNERLDSVVVVPLSSQPPEIWPLRVAVEIPGLETSFAVLPGARQVSKQRLHECVGHAPRPVLDGLATALAVYLGD